MLIEFSVTNFRSIKEKQTLSMLATSLKEHPDNVFDSPDPKIKLLKTAVIYGANASGKSNVINAFEIFYFLISNRNIQPDDAITPYVPFLFEYKTRFQPISFEIEFFGNDGIRYFYKIAYDLIKFEYEGLFYYPKGQKAKLFEREKGKKIEFGENLKGLKESISKQLLPNQLFLNKAANNNNEHLREVYSMIRWILQSPWLDYTFLLNYTSKSIIRDPSEKLKLKLVNLLNAVDTGIMGLSVQMRGGEPNIRSVSGYPEYNSKLYEIKTKHKFLTEQNEILEIDFDFENESVGTKKLYGLGGYLINSMLPDASITIDELDNSFHPLMTETLVKLFQNTATNPSNTQLIFTTHETSILKPDLFRRDQIWFTEKDEFGATSLYSLAEFDKNEVRAKVPFDKWYLSGRFGALPIIKDFNFKTPENESQEGE